MPRLNRSSRNGLCAARVFKPIDVPGVTLNVRKEPGRIGGVVVDGIYKMGHNGDPCPRGTLVDALVSIDLGSFPTAALASTE
jgi:hypothetical protein